MQRFYRSFSTSTTQRTIKSVTVYGSGLMGAGIVQVAAASKYTVTMVDVNQEALNRGQNTIISSLKRIAKKKFENNTDEQAKYIQDIMSRVKISTDPVHSSAQSDLIIEAIVENLEVKKKLFKSIDAVAPKTAIFASNTSSLPIKDIAKACPSRLDHFSGLHFFNPVPQMKLVEVIRIPETNQQVVDDLVEFCKKIGKSPVMCKDTPGFIVNRLLVPYMMESLRMVERGDASMEDVDTAMKLGAGYPMGPFELMDYVGLDTIKFITDGWHKNGEGLKGDKLVQPSRLLNEKVEKGEFGRKSGKGFYSYQTGKK